MTVPSDFKTAKQYQKVIEASLSVANGEILRLGGGSGPMGLTPDDIKDSAEFQSARRTQQALFAQLRAFNGVFVQRFKKELAAERAPS